MISAVIAILIFALVLWLVFYLVGKFVSGTPLQIIGIVLGLVLLLFALNRLGIHIPL